MTNLKIVHASIDENGHAHGGQAGDQNGREVRVQNGCKKDFTVTLRHPNPEIAKKAAKSGEVLANSNLIGYDQYERNTAHTILKEYGYNVSQFLAFKRPCEADCSSFMVLCYLIAGVKTLEYTGNAPSTHVMKSKFEAAGFKDLGKVKDSDLRVGDILVAPGSHTVMVIENGANYISKDAVYYPKYVGDTTAIVTALAVVGEKDTSKAHRARIYAANGFPGTFTGTAAQNTRLLEALKTGTLKKPN